VSKGKEEKGTVAERKKLTDETASKTGTQSNHTALGGRSSEPRRAKNLWKK